MKGVYSLSKKMIAIIGRVAMRPYVWVMLLAVAIGLAGCGGDNPAPTPTVAKVQPTVAASSQACVQAVTKLGAAKTMHFSYSDMQQGMSAPGGLGGGNKPNAASGTYTAEGDADLAANNWHYTAQDSRADRADITGEWLHIGAKAYRKEGSNWQTPTNSDALPRTINSRLSQLATDTPAADKVKLLGTESLNGQQVSRCQFTVSGDPANGDTNYDLWVDGSGNLAQYTATRKGGTITLAVSKLDEAVSIEAPVQE